MRHYFKDSRRPSKTKLFNFAEKNGAAYIEEDEAIWIIPKKYGDTLACMKLKSNGRVKFGVVDESCMNFITTEGSWYKEEQAWMTKIMTRFKNYKP